MVYLCGACYSLLKILKGTTKVIFSRYCNRCEYDQYDWMWVDIGGESGGA